MLETAKKNVEMTARATGRTHISDYLPQAELDKFLKRAAAVTKGEKPPEEGNDYEANKLTESNVGYQVTPLGLF